MHSLCSAFLVLLLAAGPPAGAADSADGLLRATPAQTPAEWQALLDTPCAGARVVQFGPGVYRLNSPSGLRVPSHTTLLLHGAEFLLEGVPVEDGQFFLLEKVEGVVIQGGLLRGARAQWDPGVNIAGIRAHAIQGLTVVDTEFRDLSSNAVGVFGTGAEAPSRGIVLRNIRTSNCCNYYGDYLSEQRGPAPGSVREDQGAVAFYHVADWLVDGCHFEGSQSDGTHFYQSHEGRFVHSVVRGSTMGGYFLEGCRNVVATGNLIQHNGSRGVTIERDSVGCVLADNIIEFSGREGLWAPAVAEILVSGNLFRLNGQKDDKHLDSEIRINVDEQYTVHPEKIMIRGNLFLTASHQTSAIQLNDGVRGVSVRGNTFSGQAPALEASEATRSACDLESGL